FNSARNENGVLTALPPELRHVSFRLGLLPRAARYSLAQWAHLRWTRMLLGRGAGNPLLRGGCGFRPVRGCRYHMHDLVAAAFELVEHFGQREDGAGVNVVQQLDAPAARLDTADGASRNLAIVERVQSSATKSALQVISPWAARYCSTDFWRNRPGIRKKGDTACESPMALRNDSKPSSISRAA